MPSFAKVATVLSLAGAASAAVTAAMGTVARFPCTTTDTTTGVKSANQDACDYATIVASISFCAADTGSLSGNYGDVDGGGYKNLGYIPKNSECVIDSASGDYFCGFTGASGALGATCSSDSECLGNIYCNDNFGEVNSAGVCGGSTDETEGAICYDGCVVGNFLCNAGVCDTDSFACFPQADAADAVQASARARARRDNAPRGSDCPASHSACPLSSGSSGFECVDVLSNLEQCGACASSGGVDCTAIPGVEAVGCVEGRCEIWSCDDAHVWDEKSASCVKDDSTPTHQKIVIRTAAAFDSFSGVSELTVELSQHTTSITFNAASPLRLIGAVAVLESNNQRYAAKAFKLNEASETVTIEFSKELPAEKVVLGLAWEGSLEEGGSLGYYRIPYPEDAETSGARYSAVTSFQPALARRAFPCFDHPAQKAKFTLSLISPKGLTSLANTAEVSRASSEGAFPTSTIITKEFLAGEEGRLGEVDGVSAVVLGGEWELVEFEETPKISTYLVCWAVGHFSSIASSYVSPLTQQTIPLRVHAATPFGHIERGMGKLALDTLSSVMPIYEKLFDIPYALSKLDILVCDAFDAGAMENYGLICGRTSQLLHDPSSSGMATMFQVVATVGHEAAHQWFGNAVTPAWWDDLWLNEGFATLMGEIIVLDEIRPGWNVHPAFIKFHRTAALTLDALRNSHPVQMECADDAESTVMQVFSNYLKKHLYGSATSNDLWSAMSEVSGQDVGSLMSSWTTQVGFPVVTVTEEKGGIRLHQSRFLANLAPEEDTTLWSIPLDIQLAGEGTRRAPVVMSSKTLNVSLDTKYLYTINSETSGFYRVCYPPDYLSRLGEAASKPNSPLSVSDRLGILQDAIVLSESGYTRTSSTLNYIEATKSLATDDEVLMWTEVSSYLRRMRNTWWEEDEDVLEALDAFARSLFGPLVESFGFSHVEGDSEGRQLLRILVVTSAAAAEVPAALNYIKTSFNLLVMGQGDATTIDLAPVIISEAIKHGGEAEYNIVMAIYKNPPTPQHQMAALAGLTAARDPALVQRTIGLMLGGEVSDQLMSQFLVGLAENPVSRRTVWQLVQGGWAALEHQFAGSMNLGKVVQLAFQSSFRFFSSL
ncbi:hypothetical protein MNV49_002947 [Pseudohyphozyma bogoriensis]|nr:hypothetical protein MNV49_002947 [Pseudohyphozyma bogoriensis]